MVNVAVSRAIDQFVIVTDNKLFNIKGQEIKSLLKYIKYNQMDSEIVESQIVSVFDLLYKEVDGFAFHKNNENQLKKDKLKNEIARKKDIKLLRFETGEKAYDEKKIISEIRKAIFKKIIEEYFFYNFFL